MDTYERATGISSLSNNNNYKEQRRLSRSESLSSPIGVAGRIPPAGGSLNQEGRPNRAAFVQLLEQIKNDANNRPFTGATSFGGGVGGEGTSAPGAQFRSNFKLGNIY